MGECIVEGCSREAATSVGKNDEYPLCKPHRVAWGYFRKGYYRGQGYACDGLLRRKVWDKAMKEFLAYCQNEIVACTQIAETILRSTK